MSLIQDYDADFCLSEQEEKRLAEMAGILNETFQKTPIYFVKIETFEKFSRNVSFSLNRSDFKEIMDKQKNNGLRSLMGMLKDKIANYGNLQINQESVAFFSPTGDIISNRPHIIICPGKIRFDQKEVFNDIIICVILHELGHAYFHRTEGNEVAKQELNSFFQTLTGNEQKDKYHIDTAYHVIEESLCEAYAFSRFTDTTNIIGFLADQGRPPEYTSFPFWVKNMNRNAIGLSMYDWRIKNIDRFLILAFDPWSSTLGIDTGKSMPTIGDLAAAILIFQ